MLHIVKLGELAAIVRGHILLELVQSLLAKCLSVNQEEHPLAPVNLISR